MSKLNCRLKISSKGQGHISQVITGFMMLKEQGLINLKINCSNDFPFASIVEVIIDDKVNVLYDMADGYVFSIGKVEEYAQKADFYFKRSFNKDYHSQYSFASRIYPWGLNYHVTTKHNILDKPINETVIKKTKWYIKQFCKKNDHQNFYVEHFEHAPEYTNSEPLILFSTRTWSNEGTDLDPEETLYIDNMRAECIRRLRKEFGENFIGGFSIREFAKKHYHDCLLDESLTNRVHFMSLVKKADICISTMGLFQSNGWKLGEYVAASKAIVAEKLRYSVPGNFRPNHNYLEFTNADECVEQTVELANNKELIYTMKVNNHHYYKNYLRPDKLVLNSLRIVSDNS